MQICETILKGMATAIPGKLIYFSTARKWMPKSKQIFVFEVLKLRGTGGSRLRQIFEKLSPENKTVLNAYLDSILKYGTPLHMKIKNTRI